MNPALLIRLRPLGPWRFGPSSGARDRVDLLLHSDVVFSAVTLAAEQLGFLDEWLAATARATNPEVAVSSLYPFLGRTLFAIPPRNVWPPAAVGRVRWKGARFVPTSVVQAILRDQALQEERWAVDPISQCLLSTDRSPTPTGPFRIAVRSAAAVDRVTQGAVEVHSTACLEFAEAAGLWCVITFANDDARTRWSERVKAIFRLLADSGIGGERSRGWGRSSDPEFSEGTLNDLLFPASQKLKDIRPKKASVTPPPVAEPLAMADLNPPLDPVEPDVTGGVTPTADLNPPLDPVEPDVTGGVTPDADLNPPLDPVEPDVTGGVTPEADLNPPMDPVEPDVTGNVTADLNPPMDPVEPDVTADLNPPMDPVEPDVTASSSTEHTLLSRESLPVLHPGQGAESEIEPAQPHLTADLNPPLDPVEPDTKELNPPLDPVEPDVTSTVTWEPPEEPKPGKAYWLLSLFAPSSTDSVDWSRGNYSLLERSGRVQSPAAFGRMKQVSQMVEEGSVLVAKEPPAGAAQDVAPEGCPHPVYRTGFAVAVEVPANSRVQA